MQTEILKRQDSTTSSASNPTTSPTNHSSPSLPTSGKIVIGVAVPLGIIALTIFAFYLLRRKRTKQRYNVGGANIELSTRR